MSREFAGQSILVWGAARSGLAAAALLRPIASEVVLADDAPREKVAPAVHAALGDIPLFAQGEFDRPLSSFDLVVVSPGVPANHPRLLQAHAARVPVLSELEVGARFTEARLIAVTGTNGKTTVTALTAHLLGGEEQRVFAAGNVGRAICDAVRRPEAQSREATLVLEVSSFQCEHLDRFHPAIAAVLNLRPDHLDRHGDMDSYRAAKAQLGCNLMNSDHVIVNADDPGALEVVRNWRGERTAFSLRRRPKLGAFLDGDALVFDDGTRTETLLRRSDLRLPGEHNVANALAAAAIARRCAVRCEEIAARCRTFRGVPHRIEWVANDRGVDYFNDSKATNLDSLTTALASFTRPLILIAGGRPKGEDYTSANDLIREHVRHLIVIGEAAEAMERAWGGIIPTQCAASFSEAIELARASARPGDAVLLSPACASFDMFRNYEDRGDQFRETVQSLAAAREVAP
jgi:UDP-N-acetylmuramoylalanine--D-glutamate ligase